MAEGGLVGLWGLRPPQTMKEKMNSKNLIIINILNSNFNLILKNMTILITNSLDHTRAQSVPGASMVPWQASLATHTLLGAQGVPGKSWEMGVGLGARLALCAGSGFELWARPYSFVLSLKGSYSSEPF